MMFTGTNQQQDTRFSDKEKKLMKQMKFGDCLNRRVDMTKVKLDVLRPWISKKITDILHIEDDVVVEFVYNQLEEEKYPCPKKMQINMTGFLNGRNARQFMGELWTLLLSAQESEAGIPTEFIQQKKEEIVKRENKSTFDNENLPVSELAHENFETFKLLTSKNPTRETTASLLSSVEQLQTKLKGETLPQEPRYSFGNDDIQKQSTALTFDENDNSSMKHRMQNESNNPYSLTPKKNSSQNKDGLISSKIQDPKESEGRLKLPLLGSEMIVSKLPSAGGESSEKARTIVKKSPKSRSSRSSSISTSNACEDKNRKGQDTKALYSSKYRSKRSPRGNSHNQNKKLFLPQRSTSVSLSPERKNNEFKIRKSRNSIQTKRQYRKNRNSSASSVEREFARRNRRPKTEPQSSSVQNCTKRDSRSIRSKRKDSPRRRFRSRTFSRSPNRRSRSQERRRLPPKQICGHPSDRNRRNFNVWRRSRSRSSTEQTLLNRRLSPQPQYSREREWDGRNSFNQKRVRNFSSSQCSPPEKVKTQSRHSAKQGRSQNCHRNSSPCSGSLKQKQFSEKLFSSDLNISSCENIKSYISETNSDRSHLEPDERRSSNGNNQKTNPHKDNTSLETMQIDSKTYNTLQKKNSGEFLTTGKIISLSRTPSPFLKEFERRVNSSSEKCQSLKEHQELFNTSHLKSLKQVLIKEIKSDKFVSQHAKNCHDVLSNKESFDDIGILASSEENFLNVKATDGKLFREGSAMNGNQNKYGTPSDVHKERSSVNFQQRKKDIHIQNVEILVKNIVASTDINEGHTHSISSLKKSKTDFQSKNCADNSSTEAYKCEKLMEENCLVSQCSSQFKKKKTKKHKSRSKKHKKQKRRLKKMYLESIGAEDGGKEKNIVINEAVEAVTKANDDLEKRLRERALKSIKRID